MVLLCRVFAMALLVLTVAEFAALPLFGGQLWGGHSIRGVVRCAPGESDALRRQQECTQILKGLRSRS